MGVSTATLRRRLEHEHGVRSSDVVEELRRERAALQLSDPYLTIDEVAYQAGFSQTSAFYRAFKRWYGCTPVQYRRAHPALERRIRSIGARAATPKGIECPCAAARSHENMRGRSKTA